MSTSRTGARTRSRRTEAGRRFTDSHGESLVRGSLRLLVQKESGRTSGGSAERSGAPLPASVPEPREAAPRFLQPEPRPRPLVQIDRVLEVRFGGDEVPEGLGQQSEW